MPTLIEVEKLINEIDVNKSSCVQNIDTKFCKESMLSIPRVIWRLFYVSLERGIVPIDWTKGTITVIPKDGDLRIDTNGQPPYQKKR